MFEAGIIDPTKVTRTALQNAASIAALMLTTEAMITNIKDDEKEGAPANRRRGPLRIRATSLFTMLNVPMGDLLARVVLAGL